MRRPKSSVVMIAVLTAFAAFAAVPQAIAATKPPTIDNSSLGNGGRPCSTTGQTLGGLAGDLEAVGTEPDQNVVSGLTYTFVLWPTANPKATTTLTDDHLLSGWLARGNVSDEVLKNATAYSWHVRVADSNGTSAWSSTCRFSYDSAPPKVPTITSPNFPDQNNFGPVGQRVVFALDGGKDPDVGGFQYSWGTDLPVIGCSYSGPIGQLECPDPLAANDVVRASGTQRTATLQLNPPVDGPETLTVAALDRVGNRSAEVHYSIYEPYSGPTVTVNQPVTGGTAVVNFAPHAGVPRVVSYSYSFPNGKVTTLRASANGTLTARIPVPANSRPIRVASTSLNQFTSSATFANLNGTPTN